jgi:hypothetical protein
MIGFQTAIFRQLLNTLQRKRIWKIPAPRTENVPVRFGATSSVAFRGLARLIGAGMLFDMKERFRSLLDVALSPRPKF